MISIIIPVYNPDPDLLIRCLKSILDQDYQDFEIILVNDGSTTPDKNWFMQLELMDVRIHLICQDNKGVSAARNTGIECASGEYIAFVDDDDIIDPRFLIESIGLASRYDADIVIGTLQYIENDIPQVIEESDKVFFLDSDNMYELRRAHLEVKPCKIPYRVYGSPCARIIRKKLLINIQFNEKIHIFEDQIFNRELMLHAERAVYIHHIWYYYYQYSESAFHTAKEKLGNKEMRLRLDYMALSNELNTLETDPYTKEQLMRESISGFIAAANYWTIQKPNTINRKNSTDKMSDLYKSLHMDCIVRDFEAFGNKSKTDKLYYLLIKRKMFTALYYLLRIYNLVHGN